MKNETIEEKKVKTKTKTNKVKKEKTLLKEIQLAALPVNALLGAGMFMIITASMAMRIDQLVANLTLLAILLPVAEGVVAPLGHRLITKDLSDDLDKWRRGEMSIDERTSLFERMMAYPSKKKAKEAFLIFSIFSVIYVSCCHYMPQLMIPWKDLVPAFIGGLYSSYFATLGNVLSSENICDKYAIEIVKSGLDINYIMKKKSFGLSVSLRAFLYVLVPIVLSIIMCILFTFQAYTPLNGRYISKSFHIVRTFSFTYLWIAVCFIFVLNTATAMIKTNEKLGNTINDILDSYHSSNTKVGEIIFLETNLNGKSQYNVFLLNQVIDMFQKVLQAADKTSASIKNSTETLYVVANEISNTALEQSTNIKEIITTMDEANSLSQTIREHTIGVSGGIEKTKTDISAANSALTENREQIETIHNANRQIIEDIRKLGNQVENIGDIVTIIRDIADQTRIIAFNAELEAVGAGAEGRNFHIIATETRRLATSTMESISNIQEYIEAIKKATESLISSSENQTLHIQEETQTIREIVLHFESIKASAENTSAKSKEIESIVDQQTSSFNQIVITLKQIGAGIDSFTDSAKAISDAAEEIKNISMKLDNLQNV